MIAILFLLLAICLGFLLISFFFPEYDMLTKLVGSFIMGSMVSVSAIYFLTSYVTMSLVYSLYLFFVSSCILLYFFNKKYTKKPLLAFSINDSIVLFGLFIFSLYLFSKGFNYSPNEKQFLIASNTYLDFGVHIPLIRSFSLENNFPFQIPFFSGGEVFYHFMFDLYAGILEFLGLKIHYAYNLISAISFTSLLIMIYKLSFLLFRKISVAFLSVVLFLMSSSLSFLEYFQRNGINLFAFWHTVFYGESGPLGSKTIGVFWTLNTFLNQRQLIFGLLLVIFFLYSILKKPPLSKKQLLLLGVLIGLLPFWHTTMFLSIFILSAGIFVFVPELRKKLFALCTISLVFALPALLFITRSVSHPILFRPGFLIHDALTAANVFIYWFWNLGFVLITIPLGFFICNRSQKKFFLSILPLLVLPNLFQISSDMYDNHKFFNLWIILASYFSAVCVVWLFHKRILFRLISIALVLLLTLSGFFNFMVVKNDVYAKIDDYPKHAITRWMLKNIPSNASIVSNGEIYDPLSILGKKTYLGRSYYIYTYGADPYIREQKLNTFLQSTNIHKAKNFIKENGISYIVLYKENFIKNPRSFNNTFFRKNFSILYEDDNGIIIKI